MLESRCLDYKGAEDEIQRADQTVYVIAEQSDGVYTGWYALISLGFSKDPRNTANAELECPNFKLFYSPAGYTKRSIILKIRHIRRETRSPYAFMGLMGYSRAAPVPVAHNKKVVFVFLFCSPSLSFLFLFLYGYRIHTSSLLLSLSCDSSVNPIYRPLEELRLIFLFWKLPELLSSVGIGWTHWLPL